MCSYIDLVVLYLFISDADGIEIRLIGICFWKKRGIINNGWMDKVDDVMSEFIYLFIFCGI